jgi:hypothetical protein
MPVMWPSRRIEETLRAIAAEAIYGCDAPDHSDGLSLEALHAQIDKDENNWCRSHRPRERWCPGCSTNAALEDAAAVIRDLVATRAPS